MKNLKLTTTMLLAALSIPVTAKQEPAAQDAAEPNAVRVELNDEQIKAVTDDAVIIDRDGIGGFIKVEGDGVRKIIGPDGQELALEGPGLVVIKPNGDVQHVNGLEEQLDFEAEPRDHVRGPFLGVNAQPLDIESAKELGLKRSTGLKVNYVAGGGPASTAGLKKGDVLTKLNDQVLVNAEQFAVLVRSQQIGDTVTLHGLRNGEAIQLEAKLGEADVLPLGPGGKDLDQEWRIQLNPAQRIGGNPLGPEIEIRPGVWIGDGWADPDQAPEELR
ncbi:MAG: PDZ domain-containing protein, partial [Planctomycetota bacterium]